MPDVLKTYLQDCKDKKLSFDQVHPQLINSGYSPEVIAEAKIWYDKLDAPVTTSLPPAIPTALDASKFTPETPRKSKKALIASLVLGLFIFLLSGLSVSAYLIAADKIPFSNSKLKAQISKIVFSIPFVPKTPKIVLAGIPSAHEKVSKSSYNISLAIDSDGTQGMSIPGLNSLDFILTGYSDISDPKNPRFTMAVQASKEISAQVRKPDQNLYLKVDQVPVIFTAALGLEPAILDQLLANWLIIDTSTLETEARKNLDELVSDTDTNLTQTEAEARAMALLTRILEEDIAPDLVMTSEMIDSSPVYKITYQPSTEDLTKIVSKILLEYEEDSDSNDSVETLEAVKQIKNLSVVFYVDKKESYMRRFDLTLSVEPEMNDDKDLPSSLSDLPLSFAPPSKASISMVLKLSDFGKDLPIEVPSPALTPEEFLQLFYDTVGGLPGPLGMTP